jgi:hypothetical protein
VATHGSKECDSARRRSSTPLVSRHQRRTPWAGLGAGQRVIESWHYTLEFELRSLHTFATRAAARAAVAARIEDYNHVRQHSALA